ncbi:MAG: metal ABC transporter ATP-binding protein [Acidimicrobiia bacterium]
MTMAVVTADDLVVAYGSHVAIDRSSFSIPAGTVTAIIGPNGSGKSSLLNAITGLITPAAGTIETPGLASATDISYVLQTTQVNEALPISVKEVVSMGRYASAGAYRWLDADDKAAVADAMERMDITDLATRHLHDLSGGQRQRVFVAQGLAQDHKILLLDEPLTGIDLPTAQAIDKVIHDETTRGCSVIMTTHDLSEAQVADHVLLLSGRVIASGPPADVLTRDHLVEAYGPSLLHVGEGGQVFLDDPAHSHIPGRHSHRERSIHTEASPSELHGDTP